MIDNFALEKSKIANLPIAFFDSGLGGMAVLKALQAIYPFESCRYYGDTARLPYGALQKNQIQKHCMQGLRFLLQEPVKLFVLACNTASICSREVLEKSFSVPHVDVFASTLEEACLESRNSKVVLFATRATVESKIYEIAIKKRRKDLDLLSIACPNFVPLIERAKMDLLEKEIVQTCKKLKEHKVDTLILACTHYALIRDLILKHLPYELNVVCSATACARAVFKYLKEQDLLAENKTRKDRFFVSSNPSNFSKNIERYFAVKNLHVQKANFHYNLA